MEKAQVLEKIRGLVLSHNPGLREVRPDQNCFSELGFDSLKMMMLILDLEREFAVEIRGDDIARARLSSPNAIADLITERRARQRV